MKETKIQTVNNKFRITAEVIFAAELDSKTLGPVKDFLHKFLKFAERISETRGHRASLNYLKEVRLAFTRYLSGRPLQSQELNFTIGMTNDGLPKILGPVLHLVREGNNPSVIRCVLTVLCYGRSIELPPEIVPTHSITRPLNHEPLFKNELDDYKAFVKRTVKRFHPDDISVKPFTEFPLMLGRGPHGPAMNTCIWEAIQLDSHHIEALSLIAPGLESRLRHLLAYLPIYFEDWDKRFGLTGGTTFWWGRISRIPDKEGKTRVITILNYWAQTALKPLHDSCETILRSLPWDCTYNQGNFKVITNTNTDHSYHSIDLKDATDRFPRFLQEATIDAIWGEPHGVAWDYILSQPVWDPEAKQLIGYSVGQPMGAYSSWPIFALTHGLLISYLASKVGCGDRCFKVLGDDVVIRDNNLSVLYRETLDDLGVPVSESKTMSSKTTFEFAKRWFHKGAEVSPFPMNAIHENLTFPPGMVETFRIASEKGWLSRAFEIGPVMAKNLLNAHKINPVFTRKILMGFNLFTSFPKASDSIELIQEKSVKFLRLSGQYVSCVSWRSHITDAFPRHIRNAVLEMFNEDAEKALESLSGPFETDISAWDDEIRDEALEAFTEYYLETVEPCNDQLTSPEYLPTEVMPLLNVLISSKRRMTELLRTEDEEGLIIFDNKNLTSLWEKLEAYLKGYPGVKLLTSEYLRKERTQRRILRTKARIITKVQSLISKAPHVLSEPGPRI